MKGLLCFYVNFYPDLGQNDRDTLAFIREFNSELIEKVHGEGEYQVMFIPVTKEGTRLEKVDFDKPFPRFKPPGSMEIDDDGKVITTPVIVEKEDEDD